MVQRNALVRTSIIIASRRFASETNTIIVDLYESAMNEESLFGNVTSNANFANFRAKGDSIPNVCEIKQLSTNTIFGVQTEKFKECLKSVSSENEEYESMTTLEDVGLKISQGLRTGANGFFYLKHVSGDVYQSDISAAFIRTWMVCFYQLSKGNQI